MGDFLISGPPGTGKTSIAGHVAARLGRPFNVVRLDAVMSPMLGDTARNLRQAFESARGKDGFLFLDEIDAVAKARDDSRDIGELKRVVNTLIQALDALPADAVVVAATNHPQLLDPAIWRRFPFQAQLTLPSTELRRHLWEHHLQLENSTPKDGCPGGRRCATALAAISDGLSGSDIREIARSARRLALLDGAPVNIASVSDAVLASTDGRLAMPRRMRAADRVELRNRLASDGRLTITDRATLRGVSQQAESVSKRRHAAAK
ncbi:MAG: AAA family ATPase [Janthinobacterium lividum]